jgi:hypothetical protein
MPNPTYFSRKDAREYLGAVHGIPLEEYSLANFATNGGGPRFVRVGRHALYRPAWLDRWALSFASQPMRKPARRVAIERSKRKASEARAQGG